MVLECGFGMPREHSAGRRTASRAAKRSVGNAWTLGVRLSGWIAVPSIAVQASGGETVDGSDVALA